MQTPSISPPRIQSLARQAGPALHVVALHDGFVSLQGASFALRCLESAVSPGMRVRSHLWDFGVLTRPDVSKASARVASTADFLLVAGSATSPLPDHVQSWMATTMKANGEAVPVILGITGNGSSKATDDAPSFQVDLNRIATQWKAPLLCDEDFYESLRRPITHGDPGGKQ